MEQLRIRVTGTTPLLMHSDKLADPLNPDTKAHKELTGKRKKTDEDHHAIARSEYLAGLYWTKADGVHIPGQNFDATFLAGAKLQKMGTHWKRGALVIESRVPLVYEGPRDPGALWENRAFVDARGVKVGTAKVMRYRPIFLEWAAEMTISLDTDVLNLAEARKAIEDAGKLIGVCEYRPRFGRFEVSYV